MKLDENKIKKICEKYGFYSKKHNKNEFTYPGMKSCDYAVVIPDFCANFVSCATDVIDCQKNTLDCWSDSRIGFYDSQRIYSYKDLEKRLIFLKKRIIEFKKKIKLENIEKDF